VPRVDPAKDHFTRPGQALTRPSQCRWLTVTVGNLVPAPGGETTSPLFPKDEIYAVVRVAGTEQRTPVSDALLQEADGLGASVVFEIPHNVAQDRGQLVSIDMYETGGRNTEGKLFGTATCPVAKIMRQGDGQAAAPSTRTQPAAGGGKGTPTSSVNGPYPLLFPPDALLVPKRHGRPVSALQLIAQGAAARRPSGVEVRLLFHFIHAAPRRAGPRGFQRGPVAVFSDRDMGVPGWARPEAAPRFALRGARGAPALPRPHSAAPGGPRQRWGVAATSRVGAPHFPANPAVAAVHAARATAPPRPAPPRAASPARPAWPRRGGGRPR